MKIITFGRGFLALALIIGGTGRAQTAPLETLPHGPTLSEKAPKPKTENGFGKARWRMSRRDLKTVYPELTEGADGNYALDEEIAGHPALVIFYFADGFGLSRVLVLFKESIDAAPDALRLFNEQSSRFEEQYGLPSQSSEWWSVKPRKITEGAREQSIATGGLQMATTWAGARTWIVLSVGKTPKQERAGTTVTYLSTEQLKRDSLHADMRTPPGPSAQVAR